LIKPMSFGNLVTQVEELRLVKGV